MKSFTKRGVWAAIVLAAAGQSALAQTSPYGTPSVLPLPTVQSSAPSSYPNTATADSLGGYRETLVANQEPISAPPPSLDTPADTSDTAAATAGNDVGGKWWNMLGIGGSSPGCGSTCGTGCGCRGCGIGTSNLWYNPCGGPWYASFGALGMTRNTPNPFWTTYQTNNDPNQLMNTKQAGNGLWGPGGQMTIGRWWCPCPCADPCGTPCGPTYMFGAQFVYWQLSDQNSSVGLTSSPGGLSTPIDFTGPTTMMVTNGAGTNPVENFFDGSQQQRIWRTDRFLNIELNGLVQPIYINQGCFSATLLGGFRYFRFQDVLTFGSTVQGHNFGDSGGIYEAYLQSNVTNNLFGGQIGTLLNFAITPTWGLYALPKAGVFGNQINITNRLYTGDGVSVFNLHASQATCSLLGELDTGAYWWMSPNCQLYLGWRVVGVTNVALADNQFLPYMQDSAGFRSVKPNGDVVLTGAFAGLSFMF